MDASEEGSSTEMYQHGVPSLSSSSNAWRTRIVLPVCRGPVTATRRHGAFLGEKVNQLGYQGAAESREWIHRET